MLCEGSAFKKVMRISPEKLKVNSVNGVKLLVQTLGGIFGGRATLRKSSRGLSVPFFPLCKDQMNPMKVT